MPPCTVTPMIHVVVPSLIRQSKQRFSDVWARREVTSGCRQLTANTNDLSSTPKCKEWCCAADSMASVESNVVYCDAQMFPLRHFKYDLLHSYVTFVVKKSILPFLYSEIYGTGEVDQHKSFAVTL